MAGGGNNARPALEGTPGERPRNPKQCVQNMKLNSERLLEHIKKSGPGQRINKRVSEALEITVYYCSYLESIPLDASLEGINTKFDRLLRDVENLKLGIDTQKTELKTIAKSAIPAATGKAASWAQFAAMATPPP